MASLPRILIVDNQSNVGQVLRATLDLLEYPAVVVEVPTGEEAVFETQRTATFDVLVCAYKLPGMNGLELATQFVAETPATQIIVIADGDDPVPDEETLSQAPYTFLVRPLAAEQFARALRRALGQEVSESAEGAGPAEDLGPVPEVDIEPLKQVLSSLLTDVGAMAVVLVDRTGNLLVEQGAVGYVDRDELTRVLSPYFASMAQVAGLVGGDPWGMHFWDGDEFDIYGLSLGLHHYVCLLFGGSAGSRALGSVSIYGRRAIEEMVQQIGSAAFEIQKPVAPPPAPKPVRVVEPTPSPVVAEPTPEPAPPPRERKPKPKAAPPPPPVIEVDDSTLQGALDQMETVDVDAFWDDLSGGSRELSKEMAGDEDALTFEEAMQLGLLPPELTGES